MVITKVRRSVLERKIVREALSPPLPERHYPDYERANGRNTDELVSRITRAILRITSRGVRELRVSFEEGVFCLYGYCRTFHTKQKAQQAAMNLLKEGENLDNRIRVLYTEAG